MCHNATGESKQVKGIIKGLVTLIVSSPTTLPSQDGYWTRKLNLCSLCRNFTRRIFLYECEHINVRPRDEKLSAKLKEVFHYTIHMEKLNFGLCYSALRTLKTNPIDFIYSKFSHFTDPRRNTTVSLENDPFILHLLDLVSVLYCCWTPVLLVKGLFSKRWIFLSLVDQQNRDTLAWTN